MKTELIMASPITEIEILAWIKACNAELRAIPGAPKDAHIIVWEKDWSEGGLLVLANGLHINAESKHTFAESKAAFMAKIETPEKQIARLEEQAAKLIEQAQIARQALTVSVA